MVATRSLDANTHLWNASLEDLAFRARRDINDFIEFCVKDSEGARVQQGVIHRVWHRHVAACWANLRYAGILAPWGHGKSVQFSVALPAFLLGQNPNLRIKIICQTDVKAMERVMGVSNLISTDRYRFLFPHVHQVPRDVSRKENRASKYTQHELYIHRSGFAIDASIQAAGVLSAGTGGRADVLIMDDIVDQKNAINDPKLRKKVTENVENVWIQRLEPTGRVVLIGTPWHEADFNHHILSNGGWSVLRQFVSDDFQRIEQEVYNPVPHYPIETKTATTFAPWTRVRSKSVLAVRYDEAAQTLDVRFKGGSIYRYFRVTPPIFERLNKAHSFGTYLRQHVQPSHPVEMVVAGKYDPKRKTYPL